MQTPSFEALKEISGRLKKTRIVHALGGSGLLFYLNLIDIVRDWDITTDAPLEKMSPVLEGLDYEIKSPTEEFASEYLCKIKMNGADIDLIGKFAIKTSSGIYQLQTIVTTEWNDVPVGSPSEWARAYELMGRHDKAQLLNNFLREP